MKVRIGLGIGNLPFSSARAWFRWVDALEAGGADSLWQTDRLASPIPFLEAMSAMAAAAGATERLKFGMNAVVVTLRDPLVLAKQCATVDYLSQGRLLPVFGVGSDRAPEWEATGKSPKARGRRADEALEIMRRLWSEEQVDFEGEFYRYRGASIAPRPVQQPLPLWIGGASPAAIRRTARLGTGWLAGIQAAAQVGPVIEAIRKESAAAGRPIPEDHYGAGFPFYFGSWDDAEALGLAGLRRLPGGVDARDYLAVGSAADILARIRAYRDMGVSKFVLISMARGDAAVMEQTRRLLEQVLPEAHAWS